ncbi:MAG: hypothetical protein GY906_16855 [bacterium]|nr:hypothetical protein [bacterium]
MTETTTTLKDAVEENGSYAVWDLMDDDEKTAAATALWSSGDRETRAAIELGLAAELKFRPQSVRRLPAAKVAPRLVRMAPTYPESVVFQFLFHLHMSERRELLVEFLDAVEMPHQDGVLDIEEDTPPPDAKKVKTAAEKLASSHGKRALVYLATLRVADEKLWGNVDSVLENYDEKGEAIKS